jgi:hypothetical protein
MVNFLLEAAITNSVLKVKVIAVKRLTSLAELNSTIIEQFNTIVEGLEIHIEQEELDRLGLVGQVQNMIQIPLLASNDVFERLNTYAEIADDILAILPEIEDTSPEAVNVTLVVEMSIIAILVAMAEIVTTGLLQTRAQTIEAANFLIEKLESYTESLDDRQVVFQENQIDRQYFSQLQSYSSAAKLISAAIQYLLLAAFNLRVEKRFTLSEPRVPIEIAISEYGDLGEDDSNLDLFIDANKLKGNEILLLPAGREVVVYV